MPVINPSDLVDVFKGSTPGRTGGTATPETPFVNTIDKRLAKNVGAVNRGEDLHTTAAHNQSGWQVFKRSMAQVGAEIGLGTLEGITLLPGVSDLIDMVDGQEHKFGNALSEFLGNAKDNINRGTEIYGFEGFQPWRVGWWAKHAPSVATSLSLMIPAMGAARATSLAGKAMKLNQRLAASGKLVGKGKSTARAAKWLAKKNNVKGMEGLSGAIFSRYMENTMEASETYESVFEDLVSKGVNSQEAEERADKAAREVFMANSALLLTDIPQYMTMMGRFNWAREGAKGFLGKRPVADLLGQVATEAGEETFQYLASNEAQYRANKYFGMGNEKLGDRVKSYAGDDELWTSALLGGAGGGVFHLGGKAMNKLMSNKLQKSQEQNMKARLAQHLGDVHGVSKIQDEVFADIAIQYASQGKLQELEEHLDSLSEKFPDDMSEQEKEAARKNIQAKKERLGAIEETWNHAMNNYGADKIHAMKAVEYDVNINAARARMKTTETAISDKYKEVNKDKKWENPVDEQLQQQSVELASLIVLKSMLGGIPAAKSAVEKLDKKIQELQSTIANIRSENDISVEQMNKNTHLPAAAEATLMQHYQDHFMDNHMVEEISEKQRKFEKDEKFREEEKEKELARVRKDKLKKVREQKANAETADGIAEAERIERETLLQEKDATEASVDALIAKQQGEDLAREKKDAPDLVFDQGVKAFEESVRKKFKGRPEMLKKAMEDVNKEIQAHNKKKKTKKKELVTNLDELIAYSTEKVKNKIKDPTPSTTKLSGEPAPTAPQGQGVPVNEPQDAPPPTLEDAPPSERSGPSLEGEPTSDFELGSEESTPEPESSSVSITTDVVTEESVNEEPDIPDVNQATPLTSITDDVQYDYSEGGINYTLNMNNDKLTMRVQKVVNKKGKQVDGVVISSAKFGQATADLIEKEMGIKPDLYLNSRDAKNDKPFAYSLAAWNKAAGQRASAGYTGFAAVRKKDGTPIDSNINDIGVDSEFTSNGGVPVGSETYYEIDMSDDYTQKQVRAIRSLLGIINSKEFSKEEKRKAKKELTKAADNLKILNVVYIGESGLVAPGEGTRRVIGMHKAIKRDSNNQITAKRGAEENLLVRELAINKILQLATNPIDQTSRIMIPIIGNVSDVLNGSFYNIANKDQNPLTVLNSRTPNLILGYGEKIGDDGAVRITVPNQEDIKSTDIEHGSLNRHNSEGRIFMLSKGANGKWVPVRVLTQKVKDIPGYKDKIMSILEEAEQLMYKNDDGSTNEKAIATWTNQYKRELQQLVWWEGKIVKEFIKGKSAAQVYDIIGFDERVGQVDKRRMNTGKNNSYNKAIANNGVIKSDINPNQHFHSVKYEIVPGEQKEITIAEKEEAKQTQEEIQEPSTDGGSVATTTVIQLSMDFNTPVQEDTGLEERKEQKKENDILETFRFAKIHKDKDSELIHKKDQGFLDALIDKMIEKEKTNEEIISSLNKRGYSSAIGIGFNEFDKYVTARRELKGKKSETEGEVITLDKNGNSYTLMPNGDVISQKSGKKMKSKSIIRDVMAQKAENDKKSEPVKKEEKDPVVEAKESFKGEKKKEKPVRKKRKRTPRKRKSSMALGPSDTSTEPEAKSTREVKEAVQKEVDKLSEEEKELVAEQQKEDGMEQFSTAEYLLEQVHKAAREGFDSIAKSIRSIVKAMHKAVLSIALITTFYMGNVSFVPSTTNPFGQVYQVEISTADDAFVPVDNDFYVSLDSYGQAAYAKMQGENMPYMIVDKPNALVHFIDKNNKPIESIPAVLGRDMGEGLNSAYYDATGFDQRTTVSGEYYLRNFKNQKYLDYYEGNIFSLVDVKTGDYSYQSPEAKAARGSYAMAIHQHPANVAEARKRAERTPTAADNRKSGGCISINSDMFNKYVNKYFTDGEGNVVDTRVFITPDNTAMFTVSNEGFQESLNTNKCT